MLVAAQKVCINWYNTSVGQSGNQNLSYHRILFILCLSRRKSSWIYASKCCQCPSISLCACNLVSNRQHWQLSAWDLFWVRKHARSHMRLSGSSKELTPLGAVLSQWWTEVKDSSLQWGQLWDEFNTDSQRSQWNWALGCPWIVAH